MNTDYIQLKISIRDDLCEYVIAELYDLDFEGFVQEDDMLIASIPAKRFDDSKREEIEKRIYALGGSLLGEQVLEPQNWNETWEQSIQPQTIGKFYVHPSWTSSKPADDKIELIIDPKMAFGTGYHATTRLILQQLPEVIKTGDKVLDAGTGTGILSIAALKLGAESAFGFDIDEWSETNAHENMLLNEVTNFELTLGSAETIPNDALYDVILANINRNVLIELLPELVLYLKDSGRILISGLLEEDERDFLNLAVFKHFRHVKTVQEQEWISILFEHESSY